MRSREPLWTQPAEAEPPAEVEPIMPSPSVWPMLTAMGISLTWILVMTGVWWVPLLGLGFTGFCVFSWAFQPAFPAGAH